MGGFVESVKRFSRVVLGTIAVGLGISTVVVSSGRVWAKAQQNLVATGTIVSVRTVDIRQLDFSPGSRNCPVIQFQTHNGRTVDYAEDVFCSSSVVGNQVAIIYNARNPRSASIANGSRLIEIAGWSALAFVGGCLGLFGVGALWHGFLGTLPSDWEMEQ